MGAQEQNHRLAIVMKALDAGQSVEALPGESFGEQWQEPGDGGLVGELVVGTGQEQLDRFGAIESGEV